MTHFYFFTENIFFDILLGIFVEAYVWFAELCTMFSSLKYQYI